MFRRLALILMFAPAAAGASGFTADQAAPFVRLALECAVQEYPNKIAHVMQSDEDQGTPRSLYPAFFGCFDWHSSVHGHWLLARFARLHPAHELAPEARAILDAHLTPENLAAETAYLLGPDRASWERPYGLAWLLQLAAELREWDDPGAARWSAALAPLEAACVTRLSDWLPKLAYPIRTGEHSQTAFAFGLVLDYARDADDQELAGLVEETARRLYLPDRGVDLAFEPSGQDFLSPALAEADLMRRVLDPAAFAGWLDAFLPQVPSDGGSAWLPVALVTDRSDGKLAHLDGLNLSRAWMLEGIAAGLPAGDPRLGALIAAAGAHRQAGLEAVTGEFYEGGHWLGTYAMYLTSGRGLPMRTAAPEGGK
ncbi:MAG: DUF2891 domain-containing protein [bacterium]